MRTFLVTLLIVFCLKAHADTAPVEPVRPACRCTVILPATRSVAVERELKRVTCRCALTSADGSDVRGTAEAPLKVDLPPDHSGAVVAGATLALALVTGALAIYTAKLWRATRGLVESGEATAHRQLRAYVAVSEVVYGEKIEGHVPQVRITLKNFGATPAYKLAVSADAQIAFVEGQLSVATSVSKTLGHLAPGLELTMTRPALVSVGAPPGIEVDFAHSTAYVYAYGCIEYVDTFGEPHFTRFRLRDGVDGRFFACEEGNETDDVLLSRARQLPQMG